MLRVEYFIKEDKQFVQNWTVNDCSKKETETPFFVNALRPSDAYMRR